jgi:hypothetical protein
MALPPADRHLLSALTRPAPVREVAPVRITEADFTALMKGQIREPPFVEKREALLDWIAYESRKTGRPYGARVRFAPYHDYPVAHLNLLTYDRANLPKLTDDLEARIVAVLKRGPLSRPKS